MSMVTKISEEESHVETESSFEDLISGISDYEAEAVSLKLRNKKNSKKKKKYKRVVSWEEQRWEFYKRKAEIEAEVRETWKLGTKLGLISETGEEQMLNQIETLIADESSRKKKELKKDNKKAKGNGKGTSK